MKRIKLFEEFGLNEAASAEKDAQEIKDVMSAGTAFMSLREPLKKLGFIVDFSFDPHAHYIVKKKGGKKFMIINKKYVKEPDFVHGEIAMGVLERENIDEKEMSYKEIQEEKKRLLDSGKYDVYLGPESKITKFFRSVSSEASPWAEKLKDTSVRIYICPDRDVCDELEYLAKEMGLIKQDLNSEDMNENENILTSPKGTEWKVFGIGEELPKSIEDQLEKEGAFEGNGQLMSGACYYKGENPETAKDWIVVTNNGWYFKVGAEYMVWYKNPGRDEFVAQAVWSGKHLKKTVTSLLKTGKTIPDPDYQT